MALPTINGYLLLPLLCDWDEPPTWTLAWDTEVSAALRGNEARGALRRFPRPKYDLSFAVPTPMLGYETLVRMTAGLLSAQCCVPFHGRASMLAQDAAVGAATLVLEPTAWLWAVGDYLLVFSEDLLSWSVAEIKAVEGTQLTLADGLDAGVGALEAGDAVYPLVYGRPELDDQTHVSGDVFTGKVTIHGQTYAIPEAPPAACPDIPVQPAQFLARPLFPLQADVSTDPSRHLAFEARESQIGFGAEVSEPLQQYVAIGRTITVDLADGCDISELERFFGLAIFGRLQGFWLAEEARAAQIIGSDGLHNVFVAEQGLAQSWQDQPAQALMFRRWGANDDAQVQYAQISGVVAGLTAENETVQLSAPLATAVDSTWDAHWMRYLRLKSDELKITFDADNIGSAEIEVAELPIEYAAVELGQRPAYGYHFWRLVNGNRKDWYFTSFDQPIYIGTAGVQTAYQPVPISHKGLETYLSGDKVQLEIDTWMFDGNPLNAWVPFAPQYDLFIEVLEVDLSAAAPYAATTLFSGFVQPVEPTGKALKATCVTLLDKLQTAIPRFRVQSNCNYQLYGPLCRVPRADWTDETTVVNVSADGLLIVVTKPGIGANGLAWYQWGDAQTFDAEGLPIYRLISASAPMDGQPDQQQIRFNAPFVPTPAAGATMFISAGCNLDYFSVRGCGKFNNQANFGGHPYIAQNLTLKAVDGNDNPSK